MHVRQMTITDYEAVYKLWIGTPGMGLNQQDDSLEGISKYLKRNPETCFVAQEGKELVGVILSGHDGRRGFIYHLAVSLPDRQLGIGKELVKTALQALKQQGINKVALVVYHKNENGNAFWEKIGFIIRPDLVYRNKAISELTNISLDK